MTEPSTPLLCVDIGNTHTHFGIVTGMGVTGLCSMPSRALAAARNPLIDLLARPGGEFPSIGGLSCASVVPGLTPFLRDTFGDRRPHLPIFQLSHRSKLGFKVSYPDPETIGPDRLANAVAAHSLYGTPAIIVDAGTAVTCDVITPEGGYEGGIIAPGVGLMRHYLHEKTALLPLVEDGPPPTRAIGRSTVEAMRIGCTIGFRGMVSSLITALRRELAARGLSAVPLIVTGGTAHLLTGGPADNCITDPDLTLRGLHRAFLLNTASASRIQPDDPQSGSERP